MNTKTEEGQKEKNNVLERYIKKLEKSKYPEDKIKKMLTTGITAYERRYKMCMKMGRDMHRAGARTKSWRIKRKLLAKSNY